MSGGSDQSTRYDPPDWSARYYPQLTDTAASMIQGQAPVYAGQTIAALNPYQHGAGQMAVDRALYGDPGLNAARGSAMAISQGAAQNPYASNPYTDAMISANAQDMTDAYNEGEGLSNSLLMARKGAFGGSADIEKKAKGEANLAQRVGQMANTTRFNQNNLGAQLWQQDVGNMLQAAGMAPGFSQIDMQDIDRMNAYGGQQQNYEQSLLSDSRDQWQRQQDYPYEQINWFADMLGRSSGGFGQSTVPGQRTSPLAGLGLLGMGAGMFS